MSFRKQVAILTISLLIIAVSAFSLIGQPRGQAFFFIGPIVYDTATQQQTIWERIEKAATKAWQTVRVTLLQTTLRTYLNNIAYESASYIASGGPGGTSLLDVRVPNKIFQDARDAALGETIAKISADNFEGLGIDLCNPSADVAARITLGIIDEQAPPKPRCDIRNVQEQWKQFGQSLSTGQWLANTYAGLSTSQRAGFLSGYFDPSQNDIGAFLKVRNYVFEQQLLAEEVEKITKTECEGYIHDTTPISKEIISHCNKVRGVDVEAQRALLQETNLTGDTSLLLSAANIFKNTLYSKFLQRFTKGGFSLQALYQWDVLTGGSDSGSSTNVRDTLVNLLRGNIDFRRGITTDIDSDYHVADVQRIDDYQYLDDLATCPQDRRIATQDNCTIDQQFLTAISNKETVAEAIAKGHLSANLPMISYLNASLNGDKDCFQTGYCYSNLAKLRKYRILPVGWEIAAALSTVDHPITLGEAVACFNNSSGCRFPASQNSFFRLVDPNWVLEAPITQCKALVNGPTLQDVIGDQRQQVCVDHPSCLAEDGDGNCIGGYGYCTQERNIWRFAGSQCNEQYVSCTTYSDVESNARSSFLANSVDSCDPSQAGCLWYSLSQSTIGTGPDAITEWNPNDRIYLNNNAKECPADAAGCQEFIDPLLSGVNVLTNGSFETYTANVATDYNNPFWLDDTLPDTFSGWTSNGLSFDLHTTRDGAYVGLTGLRMTGDGQLSTQGLAGVLTDQTVTLSWYAKASQNCTVTASVGSLSTPAVSVNINLTDQWQRFRFTHTFGSNNNDTNVTVFLQSDSSCINGSVDAEERGIFIDGVKLETGATASDFSNYGDNGKIYLNGNRVSCSAEEVGCSLYRPINGDPVVPGIVTQNDVCPAECVGYNSFVQLVNSFDRLENSSATDGQVDFIPQTAQACPAVEVDCSEFTNLDEVEQGGEGTHYYSYVRQCVDDTNPGATTFYTLEGSDTTGYQVRTWLLLDAGELVSRPCVHIDVGGDTCAETLADFTSATCSAEEVGVNPDCREFFNLNGNSITLKQSKVVFASDQCAPLRRSETGAVYRGLPSESRTCQVQNNGCTEYRGNQGNNLRTVFSDNFESGSYAPWSGVSLSNEAVVQGGQSIRAIGPRMSRPLANQITAQREYYLSFWMKNDAPMAITWNLGSSDETECDTQTGDCMFDTIAVPFVSDWQLYQTGPLYVDSVTKPQDVDLFADFAGDVNFDNIILKDSLGNLFVVKNSWQTPASCDEPFQGAMLGCQTYQGVSGAVNLRSFSQVCREEAIGCRAVVNTANSDSPYAETWHAGDVSEISTEADKVEYVVVDSRVQCAPAFQGCTELGKPRFNREAPEIDPDFIGGYDTVYRINDPDQYNDILCTGDGLFCREYISSSGSSAFFKDPNTRTCSYRESVSINGVTYRGWFKTETLQPGTLPEGCSSDGIPPLDKSDFLLYKNTDSGYAEWVGICPSNQNQCSAFIDTQATRGENSFANATFESGLTSWQVDPLYGNALGAGSAVPDGASRKVILRTSPYGMTLLRQSTTTLSNADAVTISGEVKVNNWEFDGGNKGYAALVERCYWDSPYDKDYCATVDPNDFLNVSLTATECEVDADCSTGQVCYKRAPGYCKSATENTLTVCEVTSDCAVGYTCDLSYDSQNYTDASGQRGDHFSDFKGTANLDPALWDTWQEVSVTANIASLSRGDTVAGCYGGIVIANNEPGWVPPSPGGTSEVEFRNLSLREAQSYFYFNNNEIDGGNCNGQASQRNGCVLFDDITDPIKRFNAFLTYKESERLNGSPVDPVSCDPNSSNPELQNCTNDTNRIIKVRPDRECSEWLSCKSTTQIFDTQEQQFRQVCNEVGLCNEYSSSSDLLNCANWIEGNNNKLNYSLYVGRDTSFGGTEYSGYSVFNYYPVDDLQFIDISLNDTDTDASGPDLSLPTGPDERNPDFRMVKVTDCNPDGTATTQCADPTAVAPDGETYYGRRFCGPRNSAGDYLGAIFGELGQPICVVGIDGSRFDANSPYIVGLSARGYAEANSPFPQSVVSGGQGDTRQLLFGFQEANVCESLNQSCEPGYYKFQYGSGASVRYTSINGALTSDEVPLCICQGGDKDGQACLDGDQNNDNIVTTEDRCPGNGNPAVLRRAETFLNWPGYCLEPDLSSNINGSSSEYACLTWLPVDTSPAGLDFFAQNRGAGYSLKAPVYQCLEFNIKEWRTSFVTPCMESEHDFDKRWTYISDGKPVDDTDENGSNARIGSQRKYLAVEGRECGGGLFENDNYYNVYPILGPDCVGEKIGRVAGYDITNKCLGDYDGETLFIRYDKDGQERRGDSDPFTACSVISESVSPRGENAAITNLFWSDYKLDGGFKVDLNNAGGGEVALADDSAPFGSATPGSGFRASDFQLWEVRDKTVSPRAGIPYACAAQPSICAKLAVSDEDNTLFIKDWVDPKYIGQPESYIEGAQRVKQIFKTIFGIYEWRPGQSCDFSVCNGGIYAGQSCSTSADCSYGKAPQTNPDAVAPGQNLCQPFPSTCLNSAYGPIDCTACPNGFSPNSAGACVTDVSFSSELPCLVFCTDAALANPTENYNCVDVDPDTSVSEWRCVGNNIGAWDCKANLDFVECRDSSSIISFIGKTCYDTLKDLDLRVSCSSTADCRRAMDENFDPSKVSFNGSNFSGFGGGIVDYLNSVAICGTDDGYYCTGPDFYLPNGENAKYFRDLRGCYDQFTSITGEVLDGWYMTSTTPPFGPNPGQGWEICNAPGAACVQSTSLMVDKDNNASTPPEPFCRFVADSYQGLCDPDTDPTCDPDSNDAVNERALPLNSATSQSYASALAADRGVPATQITKINTRTATYTPSGVPRYTGGRPPFIAEVFCNQDTGECQQGSLSSFSVNNTTTDIETRESTLLTNLTFYMAAFKDQMPIRYIDIDWGDGSRQRSLGFYKNALPICSETQAVVTPWTGIDSKTNVLNTVMESAGTQQACEEQYRSYFHLYEYDPAYDGAFGCPAGSACYKPKVMIQDNWGWCTSPGFPGSADWGEVGVGCIDFGASGYIEYDGIIRVDQPS